MSVEVREKPWLSVLPFCLIWEKFSLLFTAVQTECWLLISGGIHLSLLLIVSKRGWD